MSLDEVILDVSGDMELCETGPGQDPREINSFSSKSKRERNAAECSHKVIEKRRRDRINSCLTELGNLLPTAANASKQGSGKLEKAEILEMTVEHLKKLQAAQTVINESSPPKEDASEKASSTATEAPSPEEPAKDITEKKYRGGYRDCTRDVLNFLVNVESMDLQRPSSFQRLRAHMQHQLQLIVPNIGGLQHFQEARNRKRKHGTATTSYSSSSSSSSSSNDERSNSAKRPRSEKEKHGSRGQAYKTSRNGTSSGSDKESSNSDSAVCLDDFTDEDLTRNSSGNDKNPSSDPPFSANKSTPPYSPRSPGLLEGLLGTLPQAIPIPLRNPFMQTPFSTPTYALHPAGTHYIPVSLHTGVPFPSYAAAMPNASCGLLPNVNSPGMGLPGIPPGFVGMPLQANPYGMPFMGQNFAGFPSYPGVMPEYAMNRASHPVKMESTSSEDSSSSSSNTDSRISGNGNLTVNNSPSPNSSNDS